MRRGFITLGTWCMDRNIILDVWPGEDMAAHARQISFAGGGSACNFAVNIKKLDESMHVETQGIIGNDEKADFLVSIADEYGIMRSRLVRSNEETHRRQTHSFQKNQTAAHIFYMQVSQIF